MKTSVLIIAHNEEKYISKCVESILNQTQKPDEIVLIIHNSTDKTLEISKRYPISVVQFDGVPGISSARIEGLNHIHNEIIICIDGDSYAEKNWVSVMSQTLQRDNVLVGSWVRFKGTAWGFVRNFFVKKIPVSKSKNATERIWGPSFGFWSKDKEKVKAIWQKSTELSRELNLTRNPEDYWLGLFMSREGNLEVTDKTCVTQYSKEKNSYKAIIRNKENIMNGKIMRNYFDSLGA
jgi:glycosyltransferase involved in cell wall biosynthesis